MPSAPRQSLFLRMFRVLSFWGAAMAILVAVGFVRGMLPPLLGPLAWGTLSSLALFFLVRFFLHGDRRSLVDAGLAWTPRSPVRFLAGVGLGVATYAAILVASVLVLGPIRLVAGSPPDAGSILLIVLGLLALASMEELAFRSYSLWTAVRTLGVWSAQLLVAVAFSLLHVSYGWPLSTVLLGVFPTAILFGIAAIVSGGLAVPLGVHFGINLGRWATGESDGAGLWALDSSAIDPSRASTLAPAIGAAVPLAVALILIVLFRNRITIRSA